MGVELKYLCLACLKPVPVYGPVYSTLLESNNETEQEMSCKAPFNQTDSPWSLLADLSLDSTQYSSAVHLPPLTQRLSSLIIH